LLNKNKQAKLFSKSLSKSYKQGYCDWVGSAKQAATRQTHVEKALIIQNNNQKILKI